MVAGVAAVAGADLPTAVRLGASMTALQASIGALNDLVDAPLDVGRADKPIPAGLVGRGAAQGVVVVAAAIGLVLAAPSGPLLVGLGLLGLGIGYAYDLRARGTVWSWLPFVVGIPLLPVYGWVGATGTAPGWFAGLLPMAAVAGFAIAVANARADVERDAAAGVATVATVLGEVRSRWAVAGSWTAVAVVALGWLAAIGAAPLQIGLVAAGVAVIAGGVALGWDASPGRREVAWEMQAAGAAIAAVGWVLAVD